MDMIDPKEWMVPPQCIPVHANVTTFDWKPMYEHTKFDVIMMDPPWQLATAESNQRRIVGIFTTYWTPGHREPSDSRVARKWLLVRLGDQREIPVVFEPIQKMGLRVCG